MLPWASPLEGLLFRTPGLGLAAGPAPRRGVAGCRGTPAVRRWRAPVLPEPRPGGAGHSCDRPPSRGDARGRTAGVPPTRPAPGSRRSATPGGAAAGAASGGLGCRSGRLAILVASSRRDPRGPGGLGGEPSSYLAPVRSGGAHEARSPFGCGPSSRSAEARTRGSGPRCETVRLVPCSLRFRPKAGASQARSHPAEAGWRPGSDRRAPAAEAAGARLPRAAWR